MPRRTHSLAGPLLTEVTYNHKHLYLLHSNPQPEDGRRPSKEAAYVGFPTRAFGQLQGLKTPRIRHTGQPTASKAAPTLLQLSRDAIWTQRIAILREVSPLLHPSEKCGVCT
jgi:hypothetical protein